ncbi:hypothetical protein [Burkholderia gladioli]|uniref:hypothetical protein n=1 Tax=Burkholderia gladioli TaxID=28095 RepID=UPI0034DB3B35
MNTTRLRQGGLIATWTLATVGIGIAAPWLVAAAVVAWVAVTGGAVAVQQALAGVATVDGLQWRTGVPALWAGLTWFSVAIVFAVRITHTRWLKSSVDWLATCSGVWIENRSRALYFRLGGNPNDAGRLSIAIGGTIALVLIAVWLWFIAGAYSSHRNSPHVALAPAVQITARASAALVMPSGSVLSGYAQIEQTGEGVYRVTFGDRPEGSQ